MRTREEKIRRQIEVKDADSLAGELVGEAQSLIKTIEKRRLNNPYRAQSCANELITVAEKLLGATNRLANADITARINTAFDVDNDCIC